MSRQTNQPESDTGMFLTRPDEQAVQSLSKAVQSAPFHTVKEFFFSQAHPDTSESVSASQSPFYLFFSDRTHRPIFPAGVLMGFPVRYNKTQDTISASIRYIVVFVVCL